MTITEVTAPLSPRRHRRSGAPVVLVLDPEGSDADLTLLGAGWASESIQDAASVLEAARARNLGAVLIAPSIDAERRELLTRVLKKRSPDVIVVQLVRHVDDTRSAAALKEGADGIAPWPVLAPAQALSALLEPVAKASAGQVPAAVPLLDAEGGAYRRGPIRCLVGATLPSAAPLSDGFGESTVETRAGGLSLSEPWPSAESNLFDHARTLVERLALEGRHDDARVVRRLLSVSEEAMSRFAASLASQLDGGPGTVLLVGEDDALGEHLARAGVGVELAVNVIEAVALISHQALDLVIIGEKLAPALLTRVRRQLGDQALPIVVLSDGEDIRGLVELGADVTVRPGDLDGLVVQVRRLLERAGPVTLTPQIGDDLVAPSGWIGNLAHLAVEELLQLLEVGRRTATVLITADGTKGTVGMRDGQLVFARYQGAEGIDALCDLIRTHNGIFRVTFSAPEQTNLSGETTGLLLEAMRRVDERQR